MLTGYSISTIAFLDSCSDRYIIAADIDERLNLSGKKYSMSLETAIGTKDFVSEFASAFIKYQSDRRGRHRRSRNKRKGGGAPLRNELIVASPNA